MLSVILYYSSNSLQKQEANRIRDSVVVWSLPNTHPLSGVTCCHLSGFFIFASVPQGVDGPSAPPLGQTSVLPLDLAETTCTACLNPSGFARIRLLNSMYVQRVRLLLKIWISNLLLKSVLIVSEHPTHPVPLLPKKRERKGAPVKGRLFGGRCWACAWLD